MPPKTDAGVYAIPCKDCNKHYFGESGRGLSVRKIEHKRACATGQEDNMISKHTWDLSHRIDWEGARLVYKCNDVGKRRVVEGALISLLNTFEGNKSFTSEDPAINQLVCKSLNINLNSFIAAPDACAISASPVQVLERVAPTTNTGTGAGDVATNLISLIESSSIPCEDGGGGGGEGSCVRRSNNNNHCNNNNNNNNSISNNHNNSNKS